MSTSIVALIDAERSITASTLSLQVKMLCERKQMEREKLRDWERERERAKLNEVTIKS